MSSTKPATIADLPSELLLGIASNLATSFSSLIRLKNVNRKWRDVVAETKLDPVTKKLFDTYTCIVALPTLERTPSNVLVPTDTARARYVAAVSAATGHRDGKDSFALDVFLEWAKEWPSHAAVKGVSPAAVIAAFFDGVPGQDINRKLAHYSNALSAMSQDPLNAALVRLPFKFSARGLVCAASPVIRPWTNWERVLPLSTPAPTTVQLSTSQIARIALPLIIVPRNSSRGHYSSTSLGEVAIVDVQGKYETCASDWTEYMMTIVRDALKKRGGSYNDDLKLMRSIAAFGIEHTEQPIAGRPLQPLPLENLDTVCTEYRARTMEFSDMIFNETSPLPRNKRNADRDGLWRMYSCLRNLEDLKNRVQDHKIRVALQRLQTLSGPTKTQWEHVFWSSLALPPASTTRGSSASGTSTSSSLPRVSDTPSSGSANTTSVQSIAGSSSIPGPSAPHVSVTASTSSTVGTGEASQQLISRPQDGSS